MKETISVLHLLAVFTPNVVPLIDDTRAPEKVKSKHDHEHNDIQ